VKAKEYKFRVMARNIYGKSTPSDTVTLTTGQRPAIPSSINAINPQISATNTNLNFDVVEITWVKPAEGGSPITGYKVLILKKNNVKGGTFIEDKSMCDGSKLANGPLKCSLSARDLIDKFNYKQGDRLIAVVSACNKLGCSD